jgi:NAD(P)H dehydrogenase (quinone)
MHVYILFTHPSKNSFNRSVLEAFTRGLIDASHTYEVGDLYEMGFKSEMDVEQYHREVGLDPDAPVPDDVKAEQEKINRSDALAFIYPVWWSDCPAKLKGWFDRVLTYGFAYLEHEKAGRYTKIKVKKAIVICSAGDPVEHLEKIGIAESMRRIMIGERLLGAGVKEATMEILGGMMPNDNSFRERNLRTAYDLGKNL